MTNAQEPGDLQGAWAGWSTIMLSYAVLFLFRTGTLDGGGAGGGALKKALRSFNIWKSLTSRKIITAFFTPSF